MSVYSIHKVCQLARKDESFRERVREDPAAAIADFRLSSEERTALLAGDIAALDGMGVHGYLLGNLGNQRLFGLTPELYVQRMNTNKAEPTR